MADRLPSPLTPGLAHGAVSVVHPLGLGHKRDGLICVPPGYSANTPVPLVVLLHGAGADANTIVPTLRQETDAAGALLLAPDSRGPTWDAILGDPGPDVAFVQTALETILTNYSVDQEQVALAGFSDGGSYALSLGLANGSRFGHIIAFSPGFIAPLGYSGKPRIFISHGIADPILPIDRCSRAIEPKLRQAGYDLTYREFPDGHRVPPEIAATAVRWWLGPDAAGA